MSKERTQGKGDTQRPCDKDKFDSEFDRIFGKKEKNKTPEELKELAKKMQDISNRIFAETRKLKAKWSNVASKINQGNDGDADN
jgi:uncharacterized protein with von Willebrand factor type A (vWA) domain